MKKILIIILLNISSTGLSQNQLQARSEMNLTVTNQKTIIDSLIQKLEEFYIKQNTIPIIGQKLVENYQKGNYKRSLVPKEFARILTSDLIEISKDLHFNVIYDEKWVNDQQKNKDPALQKDLKSEDLLLAKKNNFGFRKVEILEGNVGYLGFNYFHDPAEANETATTTMKFLENTDALIIDLRNNNGGVMEMGQFISSYFFSNKDLPLYKYYYYEKNRKKIVREMWLLPAVPGNRLADIDIYILTNNATFSAAEWMSYSLQNLKRATIVGEQTAGGAHPVDRKILANGFSINIPFGEVKDPITQLDFEGKGVTPNVASKSKDALNRAHILALEKIYLKNKETSNTFNWLLPIIQNRQKSTIIDEKILKSYQGRFGKCELKFENDNLYSIWNNTVKLLLTPIDKDLFLVDGTDEFRIKIIKENNAIKAVKRVYQDGQERLYLKD